MPRHKGPDGDGSQHRTRIASLIPPAKPGGHPRIVNIREIVNAIFYLTKTGCQWRALPHDLPNWSTVHTYYRNGRLTGVWARIHDALRVQVRAKEDREESPSVAIIDSQSVKTTDKGGSAAMTGARRLKGASGIAR